MDTVFSQKYSFSVDNIERDRSISHFDKTFVPVESTDSCDYISYLYSQPLPRFSKITMNSKSYYINHILNDLLLKIQISFPPFVDFSNKLSRSKRRNARLQINS